MAGGLLRRIQEAARLRQAGYCGIADLAPVRDYIRDYGGDAPASYPRAVSIGMVLSRPVVDGLKNRNDTWAAEHYHAQAYQVVNTRLDLAASEIAAVIQQAGYAALPMPASKRSDSERICAPFSHKLAAHRAGFGWIGKSCLLVTPENGPRVRWCTVLTDAPLGPVGTPMDPQCGDCDACVKICPPHAFTGRMFREDEDRSARYDARACEEYIASRERETGTAVCGLCLYICPHGRTNPGAAKPEPAKPEKS